MPRPEPKTITFTIDGREVEAPENTMLVDAAKLGDVEIPVFCYEPKLGQPVGACRMCLVEIEGIPKLQTGCSTPVKDGMVVYTETDRVKTAQQSVVEFLLINHPLDCPVCDKGGECPLQDITFGWGGGISRFIEPKRHFVKPLELSPLIAIDRERCILCYRCVRFSQEISEDYQLVLLERGAHSYVATFDGHPYVAPFSGNIIELCPVGALTSRPYRFRARPWDIEGAGSVCTLCPAQCNVTVTVRDERALRVLARQNPDVDDGWLCDKGRFAYQSFHVDERITEPMLRDGGTAAPRHLGAGPRARPPPGLRARAPRAARSSAVRPPARRACCSRASCARRSARRTSTRVGPARWTSSCIARWARRELQARTTDLEFAHAVLVLDADPVNDAPILDLRLRKGIRRHGLKLAVASAGRGLARPERPGDRPLLARRRRRLRGSPGRRALGRGRRRRAGSGVRAPRRVRPKRSRPCSAAPSPSRARRPPEPPRERSWCSGASASRPGPTAMTGAASLLADRRGARDASDTEGAGLLEIPSATNGRGLREAGVLPNAGAGPRDPLSRRRARRPRDRRGPRRRQPQRALPAAGRPAARAARPGALGEGAAQGGHGDRPRQLHDRDDPRARRRRLPGRGLRREGGHARAPRRAHPAAAPGDRPKPARSAPAGRSSPSWRCGSDGTSTSSAVPAPRGCCSSPCPSTRA